MPAPIGEPIIIEEPEQVAVTGEIPGNDEFLLYDEDFEPETLPKYALAGLGDTLRRPHFTPAQIATWVFARDAEWIRVQLSRRKPPVLNGEPVTFRRLARTQGRGSTNAQGERRLTLADAERYAWALYAKGVIDGTKLRNAINIIVAVARQYGVEPRERKTP